MPLTTLALAACLTNPLPAAQPAEDSNAQSQESNDQPQITTDFAEQYNGRIRQIPEQDRAWPLYQQATQAAVPLPDNLLQKLESWPASTDDPAWPEVLAHLDRNSNALDLLRRAANKPHLGLPLTHDPNAADPIPPLMNVLLPNLAEMRTLARLAATDARLAASSGDAERAAADLIALTSMARHTGQSFGILSALVSVATQNLAVHEIQTVLHNYPDLLSADQLARLDRALAAYDADAIFKRTLDTERMVFLDLIQRTFTLDETGDGVATPKIGALHDSGIFADQNDATRRRGFVMAAVAATRKQHLAEHAELMTLVERQATADPWLDQTWEFTREIQRRKANPLWSKRYLILSLLVPALDRATLPAHQARLNTAGARTVIALYAHKSRTGAFPDALADLDTDIAPDPFTGDPILYRLRAGQPTLYSRGPDKDDDQATPPEGALPHHLLRHLNPTQTDPTPNGDWILYPPPAN